MSDEEIVVEHAYTDRDVRDTPSFEAVAERYVREYTGSFQLILDCRNRLQEGYRLGVAQVRAILNTMRADPRVRDLPAPAVTHYDANNVITFPHLRSVPIPPVRPAYIELPARWHHDFGMSTHRRAEVIHKICHFKCSITYYPHATQHRFHDRFRVRVAWVCGSALPGITYNRNSKQYTEEWPIRLLTTDEATELLETNAKRMCPQCARSVD